MMNRSRQVVFLCLFFVSGACGLIYEIVWSRLLVFVFGGTTFAITTVLGCFMGGLALGSYLAGRFSDKVDRPARVYGFLEIGIGLYCLVVPFLLDLALPMYRGLASISDASFFWLTAGRVLVCAVILVIPTAFMGATLPLLSKAFVQRAGEVGGAVARLYGINTIGAFVGCAGAGFLLLPTLGLSNAILLAALLNISAGVVAVCLAGGLRQEELGPTSAQETEADAVEEMEAVTPSSIRPGLLLFLYGLSGFAAMAYQVAWTRALILSMGASTYAFSAIVACFIFGIALGSLLISWWIAKIKRPLVLAGLLEAMIGLSALIVVPLFGEMPGMVKQLSESLGATFEHILSMEAVSVLGLLIVPTLCMGALMPLICMIHESSRSRRASTETGPADDSAAPTAGRSVGAVYASNTAGTIIGATVTGFLLIPWSAVGMQRTIIIASVLSGLIATVFILSHKPRRGAVAYGVTPVLWAVGVFLVLVSEPWSKEVMVSGPYLGRGFASAGDVLFYREGIDTTVAVTSKRGLLALRVNGKPDASNTVDDTVTFQLTGHIPLLIKPDATEICVIGLGSGITAGAVLAHPVERVDLAEISSAVVEAAEHFSRQSNDALRDPRLYLRRADGRNFLLMRDTQYDLIISQPSNPWISGVANLFTREFFEIAKSRLKPGGMHCQWLQAYSMKADDFAAVLKTLSEVFAHTQLWEMSLDDYLIMASDEPIAIDLEQMYFTFQRPIVNRMLGWIMIHDPMQLANHYIADGRHLMSWTRARGSLTDDLPRLEFSAPRYLIRDEGNYIGKALCKTDGVPDLSGDADSLLNREFLRIVRGKRKAKEYLSTARLGGSLQECSEWFTGIARCAPNAWQMISIVDGELTRMRAMVPAEVRPQVDALYAQITRFAPNIKLIRQEKATGKKARHFWPLGRQFRPVADSAFTSMLERAAALAAKGEATQAAQVAMQAAKRFSDSPTALSEAGVRTLEAGKRELAICYLLKAWVMASRHPQTNYHLARAYADRGDRDRALMFLATAVDSGFEDIASIKSEQRFKSLRDDAGFQELVTGIGQGDKTK